ncbi:MAG TPA: response regulator [Bryobacteraceae bacterium]|nr:response regulator [Bryobacteraceae bacterium]
MMSTEAGKSFSREGLAELRHRLRTPLNHILGYSEMLLQEIAALPDDVAEKLHAVHRDGEYMLNRLQYRLNTEHVVSTTELEDFQRSLLAPLHRISRAAGAILQDGDAKLIADVLRIANGAAELLDFAEEKPRVDRHISLRLRTENARSPVPRANASILVVDDDEANRDILSRQLQRLGFETTPATNGKEGLHILTRRNFDVILVDFMMPEMDGLDVLAAIKENPETTNVPVIMISALDELSGVSRCIQRGADDYLFKPFDPVLLSARISAALERTRLRMQERERTCELERMSQELQRSNEDLKRFAYAASHDLQAPLRTITTHLQLLERRIGKRIEPEDRELLQFPVQAALRMSQLIRDLLTYSQVSTDERDISRISCDDVLASTLEDLSSAITESAATITHDPLPTIFADPVQLRRLLLNLISNAIKYRGERPPRIHVSAHREFAAWHFTVADNGIGIPENQLNEVFNLFRRLHGQDVPGTGLGLSICKRIMERIGGRIWVESEEGNGSTFHFTIPDADSTEIPDEAA